MDNHSDCAWIVLAVGRFGSICRCGDCFGVRVEIGNVVLRLTDDEATRFDEFVNSIDVERCERLNSTYRRKIAIDLDDSGIMLSFTRSELEDLRMLLREAVCRVPKETGKGREKGSRKSSRSFPSQWGRTFLN